MSKNDNFWDNPFGGLFDFNGDGKEDWGEQWVARKIFEDCTKEDEVDNDKDEFYFDDDELIREHDYLWRSYVEVDYLLDVCPEDYETEEEYLEAFYEAKYAWREDCEDGDEYGIDPEDYETEEEYEEALEEAMEEYYDSDDSSELKLSISIVPYGYEKIDTIKESDFPNKRRYNAAYALATIYYNCADREDDQREKSCCEFITEKADEILAANYCTYNKGFLYAQAVKDNFTLPVSLPDEDEAPEYSFMDIMNKLSKMDVDLALKVWVWLIEKFLPYAHYTEYSEKELTFDLIDNFYNLSDEFKRAIAHYLNANPAFCNTIMSSHKNVPAYLSYLICTCIREELFDLAVRLFEFGLNSASGNWKEINKLTSSTIHFAKTGSELETMEFIRLSILPLVKSIDIGMVQDEIEGWEKEIAEYIDYIEDSCEQYAFTRKNAWRTKVPDGSEYGMNPRWYDSEEEYLTALNNKKYAWREWNRGKDTFGLNVDEFETQQEYLEAFTLRLNEKRRKEREQREKERMQMRKQREEQYAEKQKHPEDDNVYTLCGVIFPHSAKLYHYRTGDMTVLVGDKVLVPIDDKETMGMVVSVGQYMRISAPYPIDKIKFIIKKVDEKNKT